MKIKAIASSLVIATLGMCTAAYANHSGDYYAPERINCSVDAAGKLSCNDFNRSYLTEDTYTADFPTSKDQMFYFYSAVAYFDINQSQSSVFFTYHNTKNKMVKLKTVNTSIRPDLESGNWRKLYDDIYVCDAGYMSCGITNLPE